MFGLSTGTMVFIAVLAVLLFGEKLPEVSRKVGKWFIDFKREVGSLQNELRSAMDAADSPQTSTAKAAKYEAPEDREEATAPKFEPPPST